MNKFGLEGKVTDMFGGEIVYDATGSMVTNDMGVLVSCGSSSRTLQYHNDLCRAMRSDSVILDALLKQYWHRGTGGDSGGTDAMLLGKEEMEERGRMKDAQMKPQSVHIVRNAKGRVMTCQELQTLLSDQIDVHSDACTLIGYSMIDSKDLSLSSSSPYSDPSRSWNELQLFWRADEESYKEKLPGLAKYKRVDSTLEESGYTVELKLE